MIKPSVSWSFYRFLTGGLFRPVLRTTFVHYLTVIYPKSFFEAKLPSFDSYIFHVSFIGFVSFVSFVRYVRYVCYVTFVYYVKFYNFVSYVRYVSFDSLVFFVSLILLTPVIPLISFLSDSLDWKVFSVLLGVCIWNFGWARPEDIKENSKFHQRKFHRCQKLQYQGTFIVKGTYF